MADFWKKNIFLKMEIFEFSEKNREKWDEFVRKNSRGSIHQISDWKNLQQKIPGRGQIFGFGAKKKSGEILATVFCTKMSTGFFGKFWFYSARGPVFCPQKNAAAGKFLIEKTAEILKKTGAIFWRFEPYFSRDEMKNLNLRAKIATQNYQPTDTLEINLQKSDAEILAQMKRKGRYNTRLAEKKNIKIEIFENGNFSEKELDDFLRLDAETTARNNFSSPEKIFYQNFLQILKKNSALFFATFEKKRIAAAILTFCEKHAIYYFGASTSQKKFRNLMAPYFLHFSMMKFARAKNCEIYDFLGIAPENSKNHPFEKISEFKKKFGGRRKIYAAGREIVLQNFWYFFYRAAKFFCRKN